MKLKGFEEYKKKRYPHHCHPAIFSRLMMAEDITDAYAAGMKAAIDEAVYFITEELFDPETADKVEVYFNGPGK